MKNNIIRTFEYEKLYYDRLNKRNIRQLEFLNKNNKNKFFELYKDYIKFKNYVGVIPLKSVSIEILPKFGQKQSEKEVQNNSIKNLLYMLSYTRNIPLSQTDIAQLTRIKNSFFEIFVRIFLNNLKEIIKRGFPREYVYKSDNLNFIRGKINFIQNIRCNIYRKDRIYCNYDEFCEDTIINHILKYTLFFLKSKTIDNQNFKMIIEILPLFDNISIKQITREDFKKIHINRNNKKFEPLLNLAYQFLFNETIEMRANDIKTYSFLFDMNKLFEEFVYRFMEYNIDDIANKVDKIEYQYNLGSLLRYNDNKTVFRLKPDIFIKYNNQNIIIDTKYKIIENKKDISNNDIFQMYAYASKYREKKQEDIKIILLYPKKFEYDKSDLPLYTKDGKIKIYYKYIDLLSIEDLSTDKSKEKLIEDFKDIFESVVPVDV